MFSSFYNQGSIIVTFLFYRGLYSNIKGRFQTYQNKMLRFISGYDSCTHLYVKDFLRAGFLTVEKGYDYLSANLKYKIFMTKPHLTYVNLRVFTVHSYWTRSSDINYAILKYKTQE